MSAPSHWPVLVVTNGAQSGRSFTLMNERSVIGRLQDAAVHLDSPSVSRQHAVLTVVANDVTLADLGSSNGSLVNGRRVADRVALKPGDLVRVGDVELQFGLIGPNAQRSAGSFEFGDVSGPVNAGGGALNSGSGQQYVAGRDVHTGDRYDINNDYDPWDEVWMGQGPGRLLMGVGGVVALVGFSLWMVLLFSGGNLDGPSPFEREWLGLPAAALAFGLFLGGGVLAGIGGGLSKSARKRDKNGKDYA